MASLQEWRWQTYNNKKKKSKPCWGLFSETQGRQDAPLRHARTTARLLIDAGEDTTGVKKSHADATDIPAAAKRLIRYDLVSFVGGK